MRSRRKQWSVSQALQFCQPKSCILVFALVSSCAFFYLTFYGARSHAAAADARNHFPATMSVLDWLKFSSRQNGDRNLLSTEFEFVIHVLAYNRYDSLRRCLRSLQIADYGGDTVNLVVHVDHFKPESVEDSKRARTGAAPNRTLLPEVDNSEGAHNSQVGAINLQDDAEIEPEELELSSDPVERNLQLARHTLSFLDRFRWSHGAKQVHYRTQNIGLQGQWLEAWWPSSDHQFALIVEDDMQLSPLYYRYVRSVIANYYYDAANFDSSIFGISLQRPRFVPGKGGSRIVVNNSTRLLLYQLVGTWGQILFPKPWREFRQWFDEHKAKGLEPILGGMVTTDWYKKVGNKIWTPWFVKFVHSRGYFNIYTNFLKQRALSVSHRSQGVNYRKDAGPDSKLIKRGGMPDIDMWEMPPLSTLEWYDFCFHQVVRNRLINDSHGLEALLPTVHKDREVVVVSTIGVAEAVVRNWLCRVAVLGMKNLLLVGSDYNHSRSFASSGHPVMLVEEDDGDGILAVQRIIAMGYSAWFARPDEIWLTRPLRALNTSNSDLLAVSIEEDEYQSGLFFVRSSDKTKTFMKAYLRDRKSSLGVALKRAASDQSIKVGALDGSFVYKKWKSSREDRRRDPDELSRELKEAGLWLIDEELACKQVTCK